MVYLPLTRAIQFYPFTMFMDNIGISVPHLLDKYGIPQSLLCEPELLIDEMKFQRLAADVEKKEGLPGFGYLVGEKLALSDLGEFGEILLSRPSLFDALRTFCQIASGESLVAKFSIVEHRDSISFISQPTIPEFKPSVAIELYDFQLMMAVIRVFLELPWKPNLIELQMRQLPIGFEANSICDGPVRLHSCRTAIHIQRSDLGRWAFNNPEGNNQEEDFPSEILSRFATPDLPLQIRALLKQELHDPLSIDEIAEVAGVTKRSVQRALAQEHGTSFREILAQLRFERAKEMLLETDQSITEISHSLGYNNAANFSRAFHYWMGIYPREFRKLNR